MGSRPRRGVIVICAVLSALSLVPSGEGATQGLPQPGRNRADSPRAAGAAPAPAGAPRTVQPPRGEYDDLISRMAAEEGVDAHLVRAIITVESRFDPSAVSRKGAKGLMQLMPETASRYSVGDPFDPAANIRGGVRYLRFLQEMFPGRLPLALAAYNAGENAVLRYDGVPPYPETRQYVDRVLAHYGRWRRDDTSRAIGRPHPPARPEEPQAPPSAPTIFRIDTGDALLYTNVSPVFRPVPRAIP